MICAYVATFGIHTCELIMQYISVVPLKCNFTHVHVYWLVHMHVQTCVPLQMMEHLRVSLTVHKCYTKGCTHTYATRVDAYAYATRMSPMCSRQSLTRIVSQGTYSSDIISGYSEWASMVIKILISHEMCKLSFLCFQKERWRIWKG